MLLSELNRKTSEWIEKYGDIQVTMQSTVLQDGFSKLGCTNPKLSDVFESTVESHIHYDATDELPERVKLLIQDYFKVKADYAFL